MQRRATMTRSSGSATRATMNASLALVVFCVVGSAVGYAVQREAPYNVGPNDPYAVEVNPNFSQEQSQRLFWGNQGLNQVGGTGWWASLTNKFPILGNMFGRMELPTQYGAPNQYVSQQHSVPNQYLSTQYVAPNQFVPQQYSVPTQYPSTQYGVPSQYIPQQYDIVGYQQQQQLGQYSQTPQYYQQTLPQQQFRQRFIPSGRDVGITDDAVIVTPPFVPINQPQPAPVPAPAPVPVPVAPVAPAPAPQPSPGYHYDKPQYRLELPHK